MGLGWGEGLLQTNYEGRQMFFFVLNKKLTPEHGIKSRSWSVKLKEWFNILQNTQSESDEKIQHKDGETVKQLVWLYLLAALQLKP